MSVLEQARRAYARLKAQRNGHTHLTSKRAASDEKNEISSAVPLTRFISGGCAESFSARKAPNADEKSPPAARTGEGYVLVERPEALGTVLAAVEESIRVGVDIETSGLDPRADTIRLVQLAPDKEPTVYLLDVQALGPSLSEHALWDVLADTTAVGANLPFDLGFLYEHFGYVHRGPALDVVLLSRLLTAGGPDQRKNGLDDIARRELNIELDKALQDGKHWTGALTQTHLRYAAADVSHLHELAARLQQKLADAGLTQVADIECRALPAFLWLARSGVGFDRAAWDALTQEAEQVAKGLADQLDAAAPLRAGFLALEGAWDWNSPHQVKAAFEAAGIHLESTEDEALATVAHPMAALLREYRATQKCVSTYGSEWGTRGLRDGRIYAAWNQLGSVAGRTSCAAPNLQQVPRDPRYRRCFVAPPGRLLLKADYSQLQLRIAAKIADDQAMLDAYARGEDLHTRTAQQITGKADVTKADRQLAKAVNFGLLFGLGAKGLRGYARSNYGLELSEAEARGYRKAFFAAYPGLERWHRRAGSSTAKECRTLAGRRRLLDEKTPYTHRLNSPVQGTEADGAKLAMALLWERREQCPEAFPVLFAHDEIVIEADAAHTQTAVAWLKQAMLDGMAPLIDPVPVEVEVKCGATWGGD
jgi:DNA polymerase-1